MSEHTFSPGITYWPRRRRHAERILCSWSDADTVALRDELCHIAELGFTRVRFELRWAEVLPDLRVNTAALRGLERALDQAADHGLQAVVAVLGASLGGVLHLPAWAVGFRLPNDLRLARRLGPPVVLAPPDQPVVLAGEQYSAEPPRDLYGEPELLAAQRQVLHETIGNLGAHPAATAWQIGADMERVRRPASARAAAEWWGDLATRALDHGARRVIGVVSAMSLERRDTLRPEQIVRHQGQVAVSVAAWAPPVTERLDDTRRVRFLHALTAALARAEDSQAAPIMVADLGVPTSVPGSNGLVASEVFGRTVLHPLLDEERQATLLEEALAALYRDGAAGVWLPMYADPAPEVWNVPPLDRSWWARTTGLVAPGGREKPAAEALRVFVARLRAGRLPAPAGPPALPLDPERYWYDPEGSFAALWADWQK